MLTPSVTTFIATEVIPAGARVKFTAGQAGHAVSLAVAADVEIGTALLHSGKASYAIGEGVSVALIAQPGTRTCIAADTIAPLDIVKRDVAGKVGVGGAGDNFGIAFEASSAGKFVEVLWHPGLAVTVSDGAVTAAKLAANAVTAAKILDANVTEAKLAAALAGTADGAGVKRTARVTFNPSANAGERTVAAHTFGVTIPALAILTGFFYQVNTTFTSATDAGTVAFSVEGAGDLLAAIAISDASNVLDAGLHAGKPGFPNLGADAAHDSQVEVAALIAGTFVKATVDRLITATVAVEALTAGKATLFVEYVLGA